jgi:hypothetical protein
MATRPDPAETPSLDALRALIAREEQTDPLAGAKVGSQLALDILFDQLKTEQGVHAETLMALAGVLVGRSVQASLGAEAQQAGLSRIPGLQQVTCRDESQVLVGDPINRRLVEGYGSPWQLLNEAARQEGCASLPEAQELLLEGIQRIGTPAFGHPRVPASHAPRVLESSEQTRLWRLFLPLCGACCSDPADWTLLCGLLAARALRLVKPALAPDLALRLAMDSAIDAAKVPLSETDWQP